MERPFMTGNEMAKLVSRKRDRSTSDSESGPDRLHDVSIQASAEASTTTTSHWTKVLAPKFEAIVKTYKTASNETSSNKLKIRVDEVEDVLSSMISKLSARFRHFANLQSRFDRLRPVIQQLLLCHNLPLFIQLMLGNHLGGLSTDSSGVVGTSSSKKPKLSLFLSGTKLEEYLQLVDQLKVLTNLQDEDQESVLAHVVLFNTVGFVEDFRDKEIFDDLNLINEMIFDIFCKKSDANFKRQNLIKILSQMALFCTYNIDWDDKAVKTHPTRDLIMTYTLEEESWLNHQLSLVESAFRSVPAGKEIMHNYMMHSLGVPLPGDHMPNCFKMLLERVRKLFFIHPEFEELPVSVQRGLLKNHSDTALGLTAIRSESRNAIEQIQDGLGVLDEKIWRENYLPIFDSPSKIAKVSSEYMFDDATQFGQFVKLISNTRILVDHPDFYKLSLLFSITKQGKVRDELSNLHFKYKMIMRRRLEWNQGPMP